MNSRHEQNPAHPGLPIAIQDVRAGKVAREGVEFQMKSSPNFFDGLIPVPAARPITSYALLHCEVGPAGVLQIIRNEFVVRDSVEVPDIQSAVSFTPFQRRAVILQRLRSGSGGWSDYPRKS